MNRMWMKVLAATAVVGMGVSAASAAAIHRSVDPSQNWVGWMNVFTLPPATNFIFGSSWTVADLDAGFIGTTAFMSPNTNIARNVARTDRFWWRADNTANRWMAANFLVETMGGFAPGDVLTFDGYVTSNTLVEPYTAIAFIRELDPAAGWAIIGEATAPLTPGVFSITQPITLGTVVQYGFMLTGPQSDIGDRALSQATYGMVQIIPEPAAIGLLGLAAPVLMRRRRS